MLGVFRLDDRFHEGCQKEGILWLCPPLSRLRQCSAMEKVDTGDPLDCWVNRGESID
jgi:hypothetical protein